MLFPAPPPPRPTEKRARCSSSSDFDSEIQTWFMGQERKREKRQRTVAKTDDIDVDGDFKKNGRGGYGGKLGLKKKLEGGLMKKVDGGLGSKKNKVDNGLGLEKKFQGGLGLNKGVEVVDHGLLYTPSTSSSEVSSTKGCSSFMSGCETPVTVLRPHLCRASPVKAASKSDHEMNNDLSPRRAARVAMLKARFANTILKAEHHHALYTTTITPEAKNASLGSKSSGRGIEKLLGLPSKRWRNMWLLKITSKP